MLSWKNIWNSRQIFNIIWHTFSNLFSFKARPIVSRFHGRTTRFGQQFCGRRRFGRHRRGRGSPTCHDLPWPALSSVRCTYECVCVCVLRPCCHLKNSFIDTTTHIHTGHTTTKTSHKTRCMESVVIYVPIRHRKLVTLRMIPCGMSHHTNQRVYVCGYKTTNDFTESSTGVWHVDTLFSVHDQICILSRA